jgi:hypothetical protein
VSGVDWVTTPPHSLYSVRSSPLLIVPIAGVALTLAALLMSRAGRAVDRSERGR